MAGAVGVEENKVKKIVKAGLVSSGGSAFKADAVDILASALDEWIFWDGTVDSYYSWVADFSSWWPQRKQDERELAQYETSEVYGQPGVSPASSYGSDLGPFDWEA